MSPQSVALYDVSVPQSRHKGDGIPAFAPRQTSAKPLIGADFLPKLERACGKRDNCGASAGKISGGDERRGRTRVAGAAGAPATGTPRSRCGYRCLGDLAGFRPHSGAAAEKAQAGPARQNPPHRGSAYPRHYRVAVTAAGSLVPLDRSRQAPLLVLAGVHRLIRGRDHVGGACILDQGRHPDACPNLDPGPAVGNADGGDQLLQLTRLRDGLLRLDPPDQQAEFVAADTADHVGGAHVADELARNHLEQGVAGAMAIPVIDFLESVEIDEHEGGLRAVALHMRKRALELALKTAPVEDIEQRIDVGARLELSDTGARHSKLALEVLVLGQHRSDRRNLIVNTFLRKPHDSSSRES